MISELIICIPCIPLHVVVLLGNLNYNINCNLFVINCNLEHVQQNHNTLVAEHSKYLKILHEIVTRKMLLKMDRVFWVQVSRVQASRVQGSRVQASRCRECKHPESERLGIKSPSVQGFTVQVSRVQTSSRPESKRPVCKCPGVRNPRVLSPVFLVYSFYFTLQ